MISDRIRQVRESQIDNGKKLTQAAFGRSLGVSRSVIANIEYGRVDPTDLFIQHLCNIYGINENWLRTGEGEMYIDDTERLISELTKRYALDTLNKEIISSLLTLPPDAQKSIADYIKFMADQYRNKNI